MYCTFHYGLTDPAVVSDVTRRIYDNLPLIRQRGVLYQLNAAQILGYEPIPNIQGLTKELRRRQGESIDQYKRRLDKVIEERVAARCHELYR